MIINLPKLGPVQFADDLSEEDFQKQLQALSKKYDFKLPKPEVGLGTLFKQGLMRGIGQTGIAFGDVGPAMLASFTGFPEYAEQQMQEAAETQQKLQREYPTQFKSYTEIESPYEALQYGAETLGEVTPSIGTSLITGGLGGAGARALATRGVGQALAARAAEKELTEEATKKLVERGTQLLAPQISKTARQGMYGGTFFGSFTQNAPEVFQNIYEETGEFEPVISALAGGISAVLDSFVPASILDKFGSYGRTKIIEKLAKESGAAPRVWKAIGKEAAKAAAGEGITESAQEAISAAAEEIAGSAKGLFDPENIQRYKEAFVKGAVGGAGFGSISGLRRGLDEREAYKKKFGGKQPPPAAEEVSPVVPTGVPTAPIAPPGVLTPEAEEKAIADFLEQLNREAEAEAAAQAAPTEGAPSVTRTDEQAGREGVGVSGEGVAGAAAGTAGEAKPSGVDTTGGDVSELAGGKTKEPGALGDFLAPEKYYYHAVRNVEDIPDILKNGLRPGTNLSANTQGQAFTEEGATILVFRKEDVQATGKGYQDDYIVENQPRPVGILKDTAVEEYAGEKTAPGWEELEKRYNKLEERKNAYANTMGMSREDFDKLLLHAGTRVKKQPELFKEYFGEYTDNVKEMWREGNALDRALEEQEIRAPRQTATKEQVLEKYSQYGLPVEPFRAEYNEDTNQVEVKYDKPTEAAPAPAAPKEEAAPTPPAPKKTFEVTMTVPEGTGQSRKYVVDAGNKTEANKLARTMAEEAGHMPPSKSGRATFKAKEVSAKKELPLTQAIKGALTPQQRKLAEAGDLKGLLQNLLDQARGTLSLGLFNPARRELALILRRMLALDMKTKLVVGTPTGAMALPTQFKVTAAAFRNVFSGKVYETGNMHRIDLLPAEERNKPSGTMEAGFVGNDGKFYNRKEVANKISRADLIEDINQEVHSSNLLPRGELAAFRNWFGDSKVVDAQGKPLVVYHGTDKDIYAFKASREGAYGAGIYATPNRERASGYAIESAEGDKRAEGATVYPVYVSIKNPLEIVANRQVDALVRLGVSQDKAEAMFDRAFEEYGNLRNEIKSRAVKAGHDGIIVRDKNGEISEVIAFSPDQVKSAIGSKYSRGMAGILEYPNAGSYDPPTDTITLDPNNGMNVHTVVHEGSHAVLSHTLDNSNHPVTKEVTNLYNQLKASSEGAYGATNVQEFAAEAWGNPEFREHLKQFKPTGQKLDGWKRLINALRRLFRLGSHYETAYDKIDNLLSQIMSPAPESRRGDTLYAESTSRPDAAHTIFNWLDSGLKKIPSTFTPERRVRMWGMLEKLAVPARALIYKTLTASQLGEVGTKYFKGNSVKFANLLNEMEGYKEVLREKLEPFHERMVKHRNENPERHAILSDLINQSTLENVAPYPIGRDSATGEMRVPQKYQGTEKEIPWRELVGRFMELTPQEQKLFKDNFDTFAALRAEFKKSLAINIRELVGDNEKALSLYTRMMNELAEVMIENYSPLYREGGYRLAYSVNNIPRVERFATQAERAAAQERLAAEGATDFEATSEIDQYTARTIPDGTMLASIVKIMRDAGAKDTDLDKLTQLIVSAFPETSYLKRAQRRAGIGGYVNDNAAHVFDRVASNTVRQVANTRYRQRIRNVLNLMEEDQRKLTGDASEDAKAMYNDFNGRFEFSLNPNIAGWAQNTSSAAFYWNLGANTSSAIVQVATLPTIVYPIIGGKYGWGTAWNAIKKAMALYSRSGTAREIVELTGEKSTQRAMLSIENLTNAGAKEAAQYTDLIEALKLYGLLTNSTARDALYSESQDASAFGGVNRLGRKVALYSSFLFHHTERMSREVTAIATYDLELAKQLERLGKNKKLTPEQVQEQAKANAIQEAIRVTERTHGASNTLTGPALGQSNLGKVLMVFKRFAFAQYYNLFSTIFRAFPVAGASETELEDIRAARRQLTGIYVMAALLAGAKGIPLYWIAALAYNALNDDDDEDFDAVARRFLGEFLFKGPVNYITNLNIADRVGWSDLIWRENKNDRADSSAITQYLEALLGAPFSILKNVEKGLKLIAEGQFYRGAEMMLPAAIKNVMKGARYGFEGANTLRGDAVMGDISGYNAAMQVLGFAPADLMKQYEENAYILRRQKAITGKEQQLLKRYYIALRQYDFELAQDLREKLFELGDKYPELGINDAMLNKSVKARDRISDKMYHGVQLNEKLRARLEGAASLVYD